MINNLNFGILWDTFGYTGNQREKYIKDIIPYITIRSNHVECGFQV